MVLKKDYLEYFSWTSLTRPPLFVPVRKYVRDLLGVAVVHLWVDPRLAYPQLWSSMEQTQLELYFCPCLNFVSSYIIKRKSHQNSSWLYQYLGKNLNSVESALAQIHNCGHTNLKVKQRQRICQTSKWRPKWLWVLYWEKPLPSKITARPLCTISVPKKSSLW